MNFIKSIRENLKNPKKKALTQLFIYLLFFIFVFAVLNNADKNEPSIDSGTTVPLTPIENYKNMTGYEYKFSFNYFDSTDEISGTYYNNTSLFNFNNKTYYYDVNTYEIDNDFYYLCDIQYNIYKLFNSNLYNIFSSLNEVANTKYVDGTIVNNYNIDANIFYKYYFDIDSNYENILLNVEIKEVNNFITFLKINLEPLNIDIKEIDIEYSNINNIKNLNFNKENYTYRE